MLIEDALVGGFLLVFVLFIAPWAVGRRPLWRNNPDAIDAAKAHRKEAEIRLHAIRMEAEAARLQREYEKEVDSMFDSELEAKSEKDRGSK